VLGSDESLQAAESITVQCLDAHPMELLLVNASHSHQAKKQYHPFVHLDHHLGAGWSSVFASSKSHVVVKFAAVPKKDKAELVRQLGDEKAAYKKLNRISGWIIPRLYGEYEWHGGRALVLSDEGQSLSHLEDFKSLPLIERYGLLRIKGSCVNFLYCRLILFAEMYCIHYLGVEHGDFEPQNVLRKRWPCFLKIIDFGFSDVDHTCPGWRECSELKEVWDKLHFRFSLDHRLFLLSVIVFPLLAFVITSGIHVNWRLWPQMH
jgi:serine/threonine protein kinase